MTNVEWNTVSFPKLNIELPVYSTAFTIFGFEIKWYGILIMLGLLFAVVYCFKRMKSFGIDDDRATNVVFAGFIGAIICARLYYVIMEWNSFKDDLVSVIMVREGGLAIYGGIIGAVVIGFIAAKVNKLRFMPLMDLVGMGFLIGQAFGRWGNFFNHECYGSNTTLPWGMTSPRIQAELTAEANQILELTGVTVNPTQPVHPCFLYESLWCIIGFVLLHIYSKHRKFDGELFLLYIGWYGLGRMVIEGLRTDSLMVGHLRVSQLVAGLCVIISIAAIIYMRNKIRIDGEYVFYKDRLEEEKRKAKKKSQNDDELKPEDRLVDEEKITEEEKGNGTDN